MNIEGKLGFALFAGIDFDLLSMGTGYVDCFAGKR